jgi:hypothetical protein
MSAMLPADVPPEVKALGQPVARFQTGAQVYLYAGLVFLFMGACTGIPAGLAVLQVLSFGKDEWSTVVKMLGAGALSVAAGVTFLWNGYRRPRLSVFVCPEGLARVGMGAPEIIRWSDVDAVRRVDHDNLKAVQAAGTFDPEEGSYNIILVRADGQVFLFNETLNGLKDFQRLVREHTLKWMLPAALEAYRTGEEVGFGALSVSPEGVHHGEDTLPWKDFESARATAGQIVIRAAGRARPAFKVDVSEVDNAHVFLALAEKARHKPS